MRCSTQTVRNSLVLSASSGLLVVSKHVYLYQRPPPPGLATTAQTTLQANSLANTPGSTDRCPRPVQITAAASAVSAAGACAPLPARGGGCTAVCANPTSPLPPCPAAAVASTASATSGLKR
jgi:hypothetical protein